MDGIDVVALDDVTHNIIDIADALGIAWIHDELLAVADEELGEAAGRVVGCEISISVPSATIRIDPGVQLHPTGMAFVDDEA